jgi:hypothetical protein
MWQQTVLLVKVRASCSCSAAALGIQTHSSELVVWPATITIMQGLLWLH